MKKVPAIVLVVALVACSFVGGAWVAWRTLARDQPAAAARQVLYYACPMHPQYRAEKPGDCPSCGMRLEPVYADHPSAASGSALPPGTLRIASEKQQALGLRSVVATQSSVQRVLRTVGRVTVDEDRIYRVLAVTDGSIRELLPSATGTFVRRDQVLLYYYAREFLNAQQAYFFALLTQDNVRANQASTDAQARSTDAQVQAAYDGLLALGMSETQIRNLGETRAASARIELRAPTTGFILSRNVYANQRFERGTELYRIADLSRVWVMADLFENDGQYIRPGVAARVSLPYQQGRALQARASNALPQFDPISRSLKVRLELPNETLDLRPDMFVNVEMTVSTPMTVTVPVDAVVDSGTRRVVYVDRGDGYFEPRRVQTGWRADDRVEIVKGLMAGERVVASANFLLDSESRMTTAAMGIFSPETDPVCGMDVDRDKARAAGRSREYRGATYYFCSDECRKLFEGSPERYAGAELKPAASSPAGSGAASAYETPGGRETPEAGRSRASQSTERAPLVRQKNFVTERMVHYLDPVCGVQVDGTLTPIPKSEYKGKTYYFFSDDCKREFERNPEKYANASQDASQAPAVVDAPTGPPISLPPTGQAKPRPGYHATPPTRPPGGPAPITSPVARVTDFVCGMDVDPKEAIAAKLTSDYKDKTYYFCSEACKTTFDKEPEKYTKK